MVSVKIRYNVKKASSGAAASPATAVCKRCGSLRSGSYCGGGKMTPNGECCTVCSEEGGRAEGEKSAAAFVCGCPVPSFFPSLSSSIALPLQWRPQRRCANGAQVSVPRLSLAAVRAHSPRARSVIPQNRNTICVICSVLNHTRLSTASSSYSLARRTHNHRYAGDRN